MPRTKKKVFDVTLPPTPCTAIMREQIVTIAEGRNVSVAEVLRDAISLFLSENIGVSNIDIKVIETEAEPT